MEKRGQGLSPTEIDALLSQARPTLNGDHGAHQGGTETRQAASPSSPSLNPRAEAAGGHGVWDLSLANENGGAEVNAYVSPVARQQETKKHLSPFVSVRSYLHTSVAAGEHGASLGGAATGGVGGGGSTLGSPPPARRIAFGPTTSQIKNLGSGSPPPSAFFLTPQAKANGLGFPGRAATEHVDNDDDLRASPLTASFGRRRGDEMVAPTGDVQTSAMVQRRRSLQWGTPYRGAPRSAMSMGVKRHRDTFGLDTVGPSQRRPRMAVPSSAAYTANRHMSIYGTPMRNPLTSKSPRLPMMGIKHQARDDAGAAGAAAEKEGRIENSAVAMKILNTLDQLEGPKTLGKRPDEAGRRAVLASPFSSRQAQDSHFASPLQKLDDGRSAPSEARAGVPLTLKKSTTEAGGSLPDARQRMSGALASLGSGDASREKSRVDPSTQATATNPLFSTTAAPKSVPMFGAAKTDDGKPTLKDKNTKSLVDARFESTPFSPVRSLEKENRKEAGVLAGTKIGSAAAKDVMKENASGDPAFSFTKPREQETTPVKEEVAQVSGALGPSPLPAPSFSFGVPDLDPTSPEPPKKNAVHQSLGASGSISLSQKMKEGVSTPTELPSAKDTDGFARTPDAGASTENDDVPSPNSYKQRTKRSLDTGITGGTFSGLRKSSHTESPIPFGSTVAADGSARLPESANLPEKESSEKEKEDVTASPSPSFATFASVKPTTVSFLPDTTTGPPSTTTGFGFGGVSSGTDKAKKQHNIFGSQNKSIFESSTPPSTKETTATTPSSKEKDNDDTRTEAAATTTMAPAPAHPFGKTEDTARPPAFSFGTSTSQEQPAPPSNAPFEKKTVASTPATSLAASPTATDTRTDTVKPIAGASDVTKAPEAASLFQAASASASAAPSPFFSPAATTNASVAGGSVTPAPPPTAAETEKPAAAKPAFSFGAASSTPATGQAFTFGGATTTTTTTQDVAKDKESNANKSGPDAPKPAFSFSSTAPAAPTSQFTFGATTTTTTTTTAPTEFGKPAAATGGAAGGSGGGGFVFGSSAPATSSAPSAAKATPLFGQTNASATPLAPPPVFGAASTAAQDASNGGMQQPSLAFGTSSAQPKDAPSFGAVPSPPSSGPSPFGGGQSGFQFGQAAPQPSGAFAFGASAQPQPPPQPFGMQAPSTAAPAFGSVGGMMTGTEAFGAPAVGFGGAQPPPAFGQPQQQQQQFPPANMAFGGQQPPPAAAPAFGGTPPPAASGMAFGSAPAGGGMGMTLGTGAQDGPVKRRTVKAKRPTKR